MLFRLSVCLLWAAVAGLVACASENEEQLFPPPATNACGEDTITYAGTVAPLFQRQCLSCHGEQFPSGDVRLDTYEHVRQYVDNGRLWPSIDYTGPYPMPPVGQLPACDRVRIKAWIDRGAPND